MIKKVVSFLLVFCICFLTLSTGIYVTADVDDNIEPIAAPAPKMSLAQLKAKFPDGKYWNHANNPGSENSKNNQDGYTTTPCPVNNGTIGSSSQTCNAFMPGTYQLSWQCMGFAEKLGYDFSGYNPRENANGWQTYTSSSALDNLKAGDIVRRNGHSIFVTAVNGENVTYGDCNSDGHCIIRWDKTITKTKLATSFQHVRSAPFALEVGGTVSTNTLTVNFNINGGTIPGSDKVTYQYTVVDGDGINVRSGAGTTYSVVTALPKGAVFTVTETKVGGSYTWGKTTYNGKTGWCVISEDWTTKKEIRTTNYYTDSKGMIYKSATSAYHSSSFSKGVAYTSGLPAAKDLGIEYTNYTFLGWSTNKDGEAIDLSKGFTPESLVPELANGSKTVTLYAIWKYNKEITSFEISKGTEKKLYVLGEEFDNSIIKLKLKYVDGTTKEVVTGFTVSGYDNSKLGKQTITVTYEGKTKTFDITVVEFLNGDLDDNKKVDLGDVTILAQLAAGWQVECVMDRTDVNGDGGADLSDVVILAQYVAGWEGIELK